MKKFFEEVEFEVIDLANESILLSTAAEGEDEEEFDW